MVTGPSVSNRASMLQVRPGEKDIIEQVKDFDRQSAQLKQGPEI
jgi:hypothetical protein